MVSLFLGVAVVHRSWHTHTNCSVYVKLDDVSKYVNENLPEKMNTVFERVVMSPIDEWLKSFESMFKTERLAYMEAKLKFDHYTQKLQSRLCVTMHVWCVVCNHLNCWLQN